MRRGFKIEYLKKIYQRYHKASRKEKKQILDEFCEVCDYNRKYAIRLLSDPPPEDSRNCRRKRNYQYTHQTISVLEAIWEASGYLWSQRLKAALPLWIPWARQRFHMNPETENQLLSISPATIDRRLKTKKYRIKKSLPFTLRGIDSDNDGAFINYHLKRFCDRYEIQFTRGRPYKKDDNVHPVRYEII